METKKPGIALWAVKASQRRNKYGSIADLPDEELADPRELERQVFLQEWGPILALPIRGSKGVRPDIDEFFGVDFGAFGTVDFERVSPKFDKARYKVDKLKEELRVLLITVEMLQRRVRGWQAHRVLRYAVTGIIDLDDITDEDVRALAKVPGKVSLERLFNGLPRPLDWDRVGDDYDRLLGIRVPPEDVLQQVIGELGVEPHFVVKDRIGLSFLDNHHVKLETADGPDYVEHAVSDCLAVLRGVKALDLHPSREKLVLQLAEGVGQQLW